MERTAWHPAFVEAIQLELEDYADVLTFESEHQLTAEPLKIDVLIIKKKKNVVIEKNIARIFRMFNVVEYKSPRDRVSIADYHKTQCYCRLYAALNNADIGDMSVSVVATRHPKKLLAFLKNRYVVKHDQPGIYLVEGDTVPTQIIVSAELPEEQNLWLNSLRNDLTAERLKRVLTESEHRELRLLGAYLNVITVEHEEQLEGTMTRTMEDVLRNLGLIDKWTAEAAEIGEARGETRGKRTAVVSVLNARFGKVPPSVAKSVNSCADLTALESLTVSAATCKTLKEFAAKLK